MEVVFEDGALSEDWENRGAFETTLSELKKCKDKEKELTGKGASPDGDGELDRELKAVSEKHTELLSGLSEGQLEDLLLVDFVAHKESGKGVGTVIIS